MKYFLEKLDKPIYKHILFWCVVFLFYTSSARERFDTLEETVVSYAFHVCYQIIVAYTILGFIVPRYKKNRQLIESIFYLILLFFVVNVLYVIGRKFFLEPTYPGCYVSYFNQYGDQPFLTRILDWNNIFFHLPIFYLQPLFFLVALQFYEKQYRASRISEQKKISELKNLRHQLNPHFLFNTLNSLYALTISKSDKAPEVIEKLSNILDYMLYGTDEQFVVIEKEIQLIEDYLAIEQIRYEDRATISFQNSVSEEVKIAPLLLLTFIENAFKHGVSQEIDIAKVDIKLSIENDQVVFRIFNTKPYQEITNKPSKKQIGLSNVERQLNLLYPKGHQLKIEDGVNFEVILKLEKR